MVAAVPITDLDFDTLKQSFITFCKGKSRFADYDFTGANLNYILDILAYNTHYIALPINLQASEMFLDSSILRTDVVSRAKELNYTPHSIEAAKASVNVTFIPPGNPNPAIITAGTKFNTTIDSKTYTFQTIDTYGVEPVLGVYSQDIDIYQGDYAFFKWTVEEDTTFRFAIPNKNIDTRFMTVIVKFNEGAGVGDEYTLKTNLTAVESSSLVYYLQEGLDGSFEIYFGDGVFGKALEPGNVVEVTYLLTSGEEANGADTFQKVDSVAGASVVNISLLSAATGGADAETIESIKFLAPRLYQAQERAVSEEDWAALILRDYPSVDAVSVWGGEKNDPPYYGKVFLALKPKSNVFLSTIDKQAIVDDILTKYNIMAIRPDIVDPQYIYVVVHAVVRYTSNKTSLTPGQIEQSVKQTIIDYFDENLNTFNATLSYSNLATVIDESEVFIKNTVLDFKYKLRIVPTLEIPTQYTLNFSNAVNPLSVASDSFVIDGVTYSLKDYSTPPTPYSTGIMKAFRPVGGVEVFWKANSGSVTYLTGKVVLTALKIDSITDPTHSYLSVTASPATGGNMVAGVEFADLNMYTNEREQVLLLDTNALTVTLIPEVT